MQLKKVHITRKIVLINILVPFAFFIYNFFFCTIYNPNIPGGIATRIKFAMDSIIFVGVFFGVDLPFALFIGLILLRPVKKALDDPSLIEKAKKRMSQLTYWVFAVYMTGFSIGPIITHLPSKDEAFTSMINRPEIFVPVVMISGLFAVYLTLILLDSVLLPVKKKWGMTESIGKYKEFPIKLKLLLSVISTGLMVWAVTQYIGYFYYIRGDTVDTGGYLINVTLNSLVILIFGIIQIWVISSSFMRTITYIRSSLSGIVTGKGDLTRRITVINMDEIGQLTGDFNSLMIYLDGMIGRTKGIMHKVDESENILRTAIDTNSNVFQGFLESINKIIEGVESEFTQTDNLEKLIVDIEKNTEVSKQSIDKQIQSVEYVSSSTEEMISNIGNVTEIAMKTNHKIQSILSKMNNGKRKLQESISSINLINQSSSDVMTFINTISDISERIKILAINASIEAARAGKAGEGFAIVAQEVRKLSEASSSSVRDIEDKLVQMTEKIQEGALLINTTGSILEESFTDFEQTIQVMDEITSSMSEQSIGTNTIIESMSDLQKYSFKLSEIAESGRTLYSAVQQICNLFVDTSRGIYQLADAQKGKNSSLIEINLDLNNAYQSMNVSFVELKEMIGQFTNTRIIMEKEVYDSVHKRQSADGIEADEITDSQE